MKKRTTFQAWASVRCTTPIVNARVITLRSSVNHSSRRAARADGSAAIPKKLPVARPQAIVASESVRRSVMTRCGADGMRRRATSPSTRNSRP